MKCMYVFLKRIDANSNQLTTMKQLCTIPDPNSYSQIWGVTPSYGELFPAPGVVTVTPSCRRYSELWRVTPRYVGSSYKIHNFYFKKHNLKTNSIGLYRDVWIAAIASSRTSLATLTGVMCYTSQCELRSKRVNSGVQWRFRDKGL